MVWKKVNNTDPGDATHFGGDDFDKVADLFSAVLNVDTVDINSNFTVRDDKFRLRNPANTFSLIFQTPAIVASINVSFPVLAADDEFTFIAATQTFTNKTLNSFTNDVRADEIHIQVRNESGGTINIGDAVYISGYSIGSDLALVSLADSSVAGTMPALGIVESASIANNANGTVLVSGRLAGFDTSGFAAGDTLYISNVGTTGNTLTNVKPTGTDLIQSIGIVLRSNASLGRVEIVGAGRSNDIPNVATHAIDMNANNITGLPGDFINVEGTVTAVAGDFVLIRDATDGTLKKANASDFLGGASLPVPDTTSIVEGSVDNTKELRFEVDGLTTATTRVITMIDEDLTIVGLTNTQTLTNKTLTTPTIADYTNAGHSHLNAAGGGQITEASISDLQAYLLNITGEPLGDLSDVTITAVTGLEIIQRNVGNTAWINQTFAEAGIAAASHTHLEADITDLGTLAALVTDNLSVFAATTSAQLLGVISDETGTGLLVFNDTPTIITPTIASFANANHNHQDAAGGGTLLSTAALSDTADIAYLNTSNTYGDGLKQIFNPNATNAGINVGAHTAQPSAPVAGDIIYNSTAGQFQGYDGTWINLGAGAGGGEANTISSQGGGTFALTAAVPKSGVDLRVISVSNGSGMNASLAADILTLAVAATVVETDQANTFASAQLQTFTHAAGGAGIALAAVAGDVSTPNNGEFWYNATSNKFRARENGVTVDMIGGGGAQTPWASTIDAADFSLTNLDILDFNERTDAVTITAAQIYWESATGMILNVPTGDTVDIEVNGATEYQFGSVGAIFSGNNIDGAGRITFDDTNTGITQGGTGVDFSVATGGDWDFRVNAVLVAFLSATELNLQNNDLTLGTGEINVTSGAVGDILKHNATGFTRFARGAALQVLRVNAGGTDLEYATLAGGGDVVGPASSTDTAVARYDDTTGKLIKDSARVLIDDTNQYLNLTHTSIREMALGRPETLADDTEIGHINFNANDGAAALDTYAQIRGVMAADGVGVEDGDLFLSAIHNGALVDFIKIGDNGGFTSVQNQVDFLIARSTTIDVDFAITRQQVVADQTVIGTQSWQGLNSLGNAVRVYGDIQGIMEDDTDTAEDGSIRIEVMEAGTPQTTYMSFNDAIDTSIAIYKTLNANGQSIVNGLFFESAAVNVPAAGVARYGNAEEIRWRNNGNTDDLRLTASATDEFSFVINGVAELSVGTNLVNVRDADITNINTLQSNAVAIPAAGTIRFGNLEEIRWRNNADTSDLYIRMNNNDYFEIFLGALGLQYEFRGDALDLQDNNLELGTGTIFLNDVNTTINQSGLIMKLDVGSGGSFDFTVLATIEATIDATGLDLYQNQLIFSTDAHDITPSATALTFDLGAATDDYIFQTAAVTRLTISDTIVNAASGVTFQENGVDISPIGTHDIYMHVGAFIPTTTTGAGAITSEELGGKEIQYMPFTNNVDGHATAQFKLPENYDGGAISVQFIYYGPGAHGTTSSVNWTAKALSVATGDLLSTAYPAETNMLHTPGVAHSANDLIHSGFTSLTVGGTPAAGETIFLDIERGGADASDDYEFEVRLIGVVIRMTIDGATST